MNREEHAGSELIDLGSVAEETKGPGFDNSDGIGGQQLVPGLSDD